MGNSNSQSDSSDCGSEGQGQKRQRRNRAKSAQFPVSAAPVVNTVESATASFAAQLSENEAFKKFLESKGVNLQSLNLEQLMKDTEEDNVKTTQEEEKIAEEEKKDEEWTKVDPPPPGATAGPGPCPAPGSGSGSGSAQKQRQNNKALRLISRNDIKDVEEIEPCKLGVFGKAFKGSIQGKRKDGLPISQMVAIKVFLVPLSQAKGNAQLVKLTGLNHRNVVSMIGVVLDNSFLAGPPGPRILLDYYPEGNLLNYLSKKENPQDYAMLGKLALDIINGCEYLHSRNVIHGNLAARNILIQRCVSKHKTHFNAKVSDYGVSQLALTAPLPPMIPSGQVWREDPIRWMPKEIVDQKPGRLKFTKESDAWSFGVVLWEMWTKGAPPYGSFTKEEIKKFISEEKKSPLSIHRPNGCPEHVISVMEAIFKVNPIERPTFTMLNVCFTSFRAHGMENKSKGPGQAQAQSEKGKKKQDKPASAPTPGAGDGQSGGVGGGGKKGNKNKGQAQADQASGNAQGQQQQQQGQGKKQKNQNQGQGGAGAQAPQGPKGNPNQNQNQKQKQPKRIGGDGHRFPGPTPHQGYPNTGPGAGGMNAGPPGAPPPYTPSPLPCHQQVNIEQQAPAPAPALESEIQRRERELELLKTQHLQAQFMQKQSELDSIVRKMAQQHISSVAASGDAAGATAQMGMTLPPGGVPAVSPFTFAPPQPPPPYYGQGQGQRGGHASGGQKHYRGGGPGGGPHRGKSRDRGKGGKAGGGGGPAY